MTTEPRSIKELSNQSTNDIIGDYFSVRQLLNGIISGDIQIEDSFTKEIVSDPRNLFAYEKLIEIFCRLGVFRPGQIAEIHSCMVTGDSLLPKNSPGADTVAGIETKSSKSLGSTPCGRYHGYRIGNLKNKERSKVHVVIDYAGMRQEAFLDLSDHTGDGLFIAADEHGVVRKDSKWGKFFYAA